MAPNLSARELELLSIAFQSFKDPDAVKIDTEKFANLAGLKNAHSGRACWASIKNKVLAGATVDSGGTPKGKKTQGGKADTEVNGNDEVATPKSTAKTPRAIKPKAPAKIKQESAGSPALDTDTAANNNEDDDMGATRSATPGAASSPPTKGTPKKRVTKPKATTDETATEEGSPSKKRVRKPKDPNAEPKTPAKRAKKAPAKKDESAETETGHATHVNEANNMPAIEFEPPSFNDESMFDVFTHQNGEGGGDAI